MAENLPSKRTSRCRDCAEPVAWCDTRSGRRVLMDVAPDPEGPYIVIDEQFGRLTVGAIVRNAYLPRIKDMARYTCHFTTCRVVRARREIAERELTSR